MRFFFLENSIRTSKTMGIFEVELDAFSFIR